MANLKYGSSGDDVKKLQEALGFTGADVDGQFGKKTQQAVIDYQKANGLSVDGIVGDKTWTKLTNLNPGDSSVGLNPVNPGTQVQSVTQQPQTGAETQGGFNYGAYEKSDDVKQAEVLLQQQLANKPGAYQPVWQDEADAYLNLYQNRDPFSYDFNSDALYNQLKDNYIQQGQMAMMDTMGQAAAMTGGYGNSFAQSVGQQTYNQYLGELNNILPELTQMAHDRYTQEGQNMLAMYDLYMGREADEYGRYQDSLYNWNQEMDRLQNNYDTLYNREWNQYLEEKDSAYDAYLLNREDQMMAAELAAAGGDYSRLQEILGLTDAEVAAIKKANTPTYTGGPSQNDDDGDKVTYRELTWAERDDLITKFERAESPEELWDIADIYCSDCDPDLINDIMRVANPVMWSKLGSISSGQNAIDDQRNTMILNRGKNHMQLK